MIIHHAEFIGSYVREKDCPKPGLPEYAFIGRSNVGKSSLINKLTNRKKLAKTSNTPGKTQLLNYFLINGDDKGNGWYLVDLPGYGYAKVSKTSRKSWEKMIRGYLLKRKNLQCVFCLIDIRLDPQQNDLDFIDFLGESAVPFVLVFTKSDKINNSAKKNNTGKFTSKMLESWESLPDIFISSAQTGEGRPELLQFIEEVNRKFKPG